MQASEVLERQNRWRLEQVVHASEQRLQELVRETFELHHAGTPWENGAALTREYPALVRSMSPYQRELVRSGEVAKWDVTLCNSVLKYMRGLSSDAKSSAVAAVVAARNHCAHAAGGRVTQAAFEQHYTDVSNAFAALGGDITVLQRIRERAVDTSGPSIDLLTVSDEATKAATIEKNEGNRYFQAGDYEEAKRSYTNGVQLAGAIDPLVLAQLYNNRATASLYLKEFAAAKQDAKRAAELASLWAKPLLRLAEVYHATFSHQKSVSRLEMALGLAKAERDSALVRQIQTKMAEYRLLRDQEARRESENMAYGPMHANEGAYRAARLAMQGLDETGDPNAVIEKMSRLSLNGTGLGAAKHVIIGHGALQDGRLQDAAREYMAAAVAGNAEGMYNYAIMLLKGQGTRKNIAEAVRWLEKAASKPVSPHLIENIGIGEAMATLGNLYDGGIHFDRNETRAREYWEHAAENGASAGCNNLGLCLMNGTHGLSVDLAKARDLFRRSAEMLNNEAMSNLSAIHASLHEYEAAARWAEASYAFGFLPAAEAARQYREQAKLMKDVPLDETMKLSKFMTQMKYEPNIQRQNKAPSLDELRAINTPYGKRLLAAKELMLQASRHVTPDPESLMIAVQLAATADRIDDGRLVFTNEEMVAANLAVDCLLEMGVPCNADMALLQNVSDPNAMVAFWKSMQLQFPDDLAVTRRAACMYMFAAYSGADLNLGVRLFQKALSLLPYPDDDSDSSTIGLLYETAVAYYQTNQLSRAQTLFTRFLRHAPADGHRKAGEAHFLLGLMELANIGKAKPTNQMRSRAKKAGKEAFAHLHEGIALNERLPDFLRRDSSVSPNQQSLENLLNLLAPELMQSQSTPSQMSTVSAKRGESSFQVHDATQSFGRTRQCYLGVNHDRKWWVNSSPPARRSADGGFLDAATPATIDELFSALKDHVYKDRSIECIVVSVPSYSGSSYHLVVEDSQREPARIAIYNASPAFIAQLVPGRAFALLNPYVRIASDGSVMLRVDYPTGTVHVKAVHAICWVCAVEQQPDKALKSCAKCHTALYCSKACQVQDWSVDGHRYMCAGFRKS